MTDALFVLQARMGSTRLPGKVLRRLGQHSLLGHCIRRLVAADAGPVVVATTREPLDDAVVAEASRYGCDVVRGATDDVLARYILAARSRDCRYIVRATADNPAVDIGSTARLVAALERVDAEYGLEEGLPYGAAVEVVAKATLCRLAGLTADPQDREHVTLFIKRHLSDFKTVMPQAPPDVRRPDLRLTVDTPADASFMEQILARVDRLVRPAPLVDIITEADRVLMRSAA
jgi:spore coat polysaccharide biosynthesis protein SpsF